MVTKKKATKKKVAKKKKTSTKKSTQKKASTTKKTKYRAVKNKSKVRKTVENAEKKEKELIKSVVESILKSFIAEHDSKNYTTIQGNIDIFKRHLEGTYISITSTLKPTIKTKKEKEIKLLNFITNECDITGSGKSLTFGIPIEGYSKYRQLEKEYNQFYTACSIIPKSSVIMLVSYFDYLLGRIIQCLYNSKPELINLSSKQLTLSQLYNFGSLDTAKEYFLEKEIEALLRKSHAEQFDWLESKFNINLRSNDEDWSRFIELTERRNLYVHTNGKVSSQYINVCKANGVKGINKLKVGDYIETDIESFKESYRFMYKYGVLLSHVLWRKVLPEQNEDADINLNHITYELLQEEEYSLAIELLNFLFDTPPMQTFRDDYTKRIHIINRAQAYKWSGDEETCRKILDNEDWSSSGNVFKLAILVLKNDFDSAVTVMQKIGTKDEILNKEAYLEWPLFKKYRKTKQFKETFKNIFGESEYKIKDKKKKQRQRKTRVK